MKEVWKHPVMVETESKFEIYTVEIESDSGIYFSKMIAHEQEKDWHFERLRQLRTCHGGNPYTLGSLVLLESLANCHCLSKACNQLPNPPPCVPSGLEMHNLQ